MLKPGINKYIICGVAASVGVYSLNQVRTLEFTHFIRSGLWSLLT